MTLALAWALTLLARSALAAPPAQTGDELHAGYSLERGVWIENDHVRLRASTFAIALLEAELAGPYPSGPRLQLHNLRPSARLSLLDLPIEAQVQLELADARVEVLDAVLEWTVRDALRLRAGRFRTPGSRAWMTSSKLQAIPGRGPVDDAFQTGRAPGLAASAELGAFELHLGVFDGSHAERTPDSRGPLLAFRLAGNPRGPVPYSATPSFSGVTRAKLGFGIHGWTTRLAGSRRSVFGADAVVATPRVFVLGEGFARIDTDAHALDWAWGAQLQAGVMVIADTLELQARLSLSGDRLAPLELVGEGGLAWYLLGNHLRAQLHGVHARTPDGRPSTRAEVRLQVWF